MKIAIDAGHGMGNASSAYDPGATSSFGGVDYKEAVIVLGYAETLEQELKALGFSTFMTRTDQITATPVGQRAGRAADAGCSMFVSLHLNSNEGSPGTGPEVLFRDHWKDKPLAKALQAELESVTGIPVRDIVERLNLAVLHFNRGPAVLIEIGFINNEAEIKKLVQPAVRSTICKAIAGVIKAHSARMSSEELLTDNSSLIAPEIVFKGKMSTFGGPNDLVMKPDEGLAFVYPSDLNDPDFAPLFLPNQPPGTTGLGRRLNPDGFYIACRWQYGITPKEYLRHAVAAVVNKSTKKWAHARPVDWGPHATNTNKTIDMSPGLAKYLGLTTGDEAKVIIAVPKNS